jgi:hypothetical protein
MSTKITTLDHGLRVQCWAFAIDVAPVRIFQFYHPTEGF